MKRSNIRRSVCLSHQSTAASACGGFAAERRAGRRYRSTAALQHGAQQQTRAVSRRRLTEEAEQAFSL